MATSIKELHGAIGIYFNSVVGSGLLGKVCRAKCGLLPCTAKVFNESVILPDVKSSKDKIAEFEKDCKRLLCIRHPSLIQYLGIANGPNIQLPLLFMEVLNKNLTHFLESLTEPLPFHMQVNISYDVGLGLAFLHFNSIIHGALSSNNVLLIGEASRAKLADFGLYKYAPSEAIVSKNNSALPYLAPEVFMNENLSTRTDCFSFGILLLQVITRQPPTPTSEEDKTSEVERRRKDINLVDSNHQLLSIALDCLKDKGSERLTSEVICELLALIRKEEMYQSSRENYITSLDRLRQELQAKEKLLKQRDQQIQELKMEHEKEIKMMKETNEKEIERLQADYKNDMEIVRGESLEVEDKLEANHEEMTKDGEEREDIKDQAAPTETDETVGAEEVKTWTTDYGSLPSACPAPERILLVPLLSDQNTLPELHHSLNEQDKPVEPDHSENKQDKPVEPDHSEIEQDKPAEPEHFKNEQDKPAEPEHPPNEQDKPAEPKHPPNEQDKPAEPEHPPNEQDKRAELEHLLQEQDKPDELEYSHNEQDKPDVSESSQSQENTATDLERIPSELEASQHEGKQENQLDTSIADDISHQDINDSLLDKNSSICDTENSSYESQEDEVDHIPAKDEKWSIRSSAPETICALYGAATVDGKTAYFSRHYNIYSYSLSKDKWSQLKPSNYQNFSLAVLDKSVITIGGISRELKRTKNLYSLSKGRWRACYSPMPNHRVCAAALPTLTHLVVAGGRNKQELDSIDVMDRSTGQWHSVPQSLPEQMGHPQIIICNESLYICKYLSIYSTPISDLVNSILNAEEFSFSWKKCKELPSHMGGANLVPLMGKIIGLGGHDSNDRATRDICCYDATSESWTITDSMPTPCGDVLSALLPDNILVIVGGWSEVQFYDITNVARLSIFD